MSFSGFSREFPCLEGDHGPADTLEIPMGITTSRPQPKEQQELRVLMEDFYLQAEHPKSKVNLKRKSYLNIQTSCPCSQNQWLEKSPRFPKLQVLHIPSIHLPMERL